MADNRLVESWTWYAFASLVVVLRFVSRWIRLGGWRFFQLEDYMMTPAFVLYTNLIVWVNIQEEHPRTNILPPTGTAGMSNEEIQDRIYGSKITFIIEQSMVMLQFVCKLCMCFMYLKLTSGLKRAVWVKILLGYFVLGWLTTEIFFFGIWCRPFLNYFRVFDGLNPQCTTAQNHLKMSFAFNISGDVLMLAVPVPLLLQSQLPWKRKLVVTGIFSLGIFVIISATLSRYYVFAKPDSILWIFWYVREASTAIMVVNIPHLYALLRQIFHLNEFGTLVKQTTNRMRYNQYPLGSTDVNKKSHGQSRFGSSKNRSESTENFRPEQDVSLQIWQRNEYNITTNTADEWDDGEAETIRRGGIGIKSSVVSNANRLSKDTE
ncbi:hypothetical protein IWW34DRAFT_634317 [Fusarium oxysporum f. sp. albedinis]|nr:hypothetical protein IWW34DRAFT_634317 [Fusarium oxysporum f. sp. albedinis]